MAQYRRIGVTTNGDVAVVAFNDKKILDEASIQELGSELFGLVEQQQGKGILLDFANVEFLSSAALGKLITLDRKVKAAKGRLKMCNIRPEIFEVFQITKLNQLFDIILPGKNPPAGWKLPALQTTTAHRSKTESTPTTSHHDA